MKMLYVFGVWLILICMKKHVEFPGLSCMTNMQNVLGF